MSTSAYAYLIVGLKAKKSDFLKIKKYRKCKHKERSDPFCPTCGEPMWAEEKEFIPIIEDLQEDWEESETPFGFSLLFNSRYYNDNDEQIMYIGRVFCNASWKDNEEDIKIPEDLDCKQILKDLKTFLGSDFKGEFGTWLYSDIG